MSLSPEIAGLLVNLTELAARNTASIIATRVQAVKSKKQANETIEELSEIIHNLIEDRGELLNIAQSLEEALAAQRISDEDIKYIVDTLIPAVETIANTQSSRQTNTQSAQETAEMISTVKNVLTPELLTLFQLVGFNYREAIGEPLTLLLRNMILAMVPNPHVAATIQEISLRREAALFQLVQDPNAFARLQSLQG